VAGRRAANRGGKRSPKHATSSGAFPAPGHNHDHCIDTALAEAERLCVERSERLTPLRREVLQHVWSSHRPIGAYAILDALRRSAGKPVAPPTVYRALEFLQAQGLVHRVESLNAFVGCSSPAHPHSVQFMICRDCGSAAEMQAPQVTEAIGATAASVGFRVQGHVVEVTGLCARCGHAQAASR
jgi:Fur family zinc uptake transcriptional regulator